MSLMNQPSVMEFSVATLSTCGVKASVECWPRIHIAGLQDAQPSVRKKLPATWRLLKAWSVNEVPFRAPPLPEDALLTMVGYALFKQQFEFELSLLLGFYGVFCEQEKF